MKFHRYIACLCEESTEETIMNLLLDADLLKFQRVEVLILLAKKMQKIM